MLLLLTGIKKLEIFIIGFGNVNNRCQFLSICGKCNAGLCMLRWYCNPVLLCIDRI